MMTRRPATSPANRVPLTPPPLRTLSMSAKSTGRPRRSPEDLENAVRAFDAADVGRDDGIFEPRRIRRKMLHERGRPPRYARCAQRKAFSKAARLCTSRADHAVDFDRLEQLGNVACRERIARRDAAVLARIGQIGYAGGDAARSGVLQRTDEKQHLHKPVIGGAERAAEKGVDHVSGPATHVFQRAQLALASPNSVSSTALSGTPNNFAMAPPSAPEAAGENSAMDWILGCIRSR